MSQQHLMSKDLDLLESGLFADATITCGDRTWKVHRSIICRCEWFKKAFGGDFEEAHTNNVNISAEEFSPELVDCVISFIYSGIVNIEKLDTNDSLVDACVRLWVIADFLVLEILQNEAVNNLQKYCDEKMKARCVVVRSGDSNSKWTSTFPNYQIFLSQLFRGVETAYTQYPHSVPCQQVLIDFFYAARNVVFGTAGFTQAMSKAPLQFSHELFMATIEGRVSKWGPCEKMSDFRHWKRSGNCTSCEAPAVKDCKSYLVDPTMSGLSVTDRAMDVAWRCTACFEKHGFERVLVDEDEH